MLPVQIVVVACVVITCLTCLGVFVKVVAFLWFLCSSLIALYLYPVEILVNLVIELLLLIDLLCRANCSIDDWEMMEAHGAIRTDYDISFKLLQVTLSLVTTSSKLVSALTSTWVHLYWYYTLHNVQILETVPTVATRELGLDSLRRLELQLLSRRSSWSPCLYFFYLAVYFHSNNFVLISDPCMYYSTSSCTCDTRFRDFIVDLLKF